MNNIEKLRTNNISLHFNAIATPLGSGAALTEGQRARVTLINTTIRELSATLSSNSIFSSLQEKWKELSETTQGKGVVPTDLQDRVKKVKELIQQLVTFGADNHTVQEETDETEQEETDEPDIWSDPKIQPLLEQAVTRDHYAFQQRFPNLVRYGKELVTSILEGELGPRVKELLLESHGSVILQQTFLTLLLWDLARKGVPFSEIVESSPEQIQSCLDVLSPLSRDDVIGIITDSEGQKVFPNSPALHDLVEKVLPARKSYETLLEILSISFFPSQEVILYALFHAHYAPESPQAVFDTLLNAFTSQDEKGIAQDLLRYLKEYDADEIDTMPFTMPDKRKAVLSVIEALMYAAGAHGDVRTFAFARLLPVLLLMPPEFEDGSSAFAEAGAYYSFFEGFAHASPDDTQFRDALDKVPEPFRDECRTSFSSSIMIQDPKRALTLIREVQSQTSHDTSLAAFIRSITMNDPEMAFNLIQEVQSPAVREECLISLIQDIAMSEKALKLIQEVTNTRKQTELYTYVLRLHAERDLNNTLSLISVCVPEKMQPFCYLQVVPSLAQEDIDRASEIVATLTDPFDQSLGYHSIAEVLLKKKRPEAAIALAIQKIQDRQLLRSVLRKAIDDMCAQRDLDAVLHHIRSEPIPEEWRQECFLLIIGAIWEKHLEKTLGLIQELKDETKQNEYYKTVSRFHAKQDPKNTLSIIEALLVPQKGRSVCYFAILESLAYEDSDRALKILGSGEMILDTLERDQGYEWITNALLKKERPEAEAAIAIATQKMENGTRVRLVLFEALEYMHAHRDLDEVLHYIRSEAIPEEWRDVCLRFIIHAIMEKHLKKALELIQGLKDEAKQNECYKDVSLPHAKRDLKNTLSIIDTLPVPPKGRSACHLGILSYLAREDTDRTLEILESGEMILDPVDRDQGYEWIAQAFLEKKRPEAAIALAIRKIRSRDSANKVVRQAIHDMREQRGLDEVRHYINSEAIPEEWRQECLVHLMEENSLAFFGIHLLNRR